METVTVNLPLETYRKLERLAKAFELTPEEMLQNIILDEVEV